MRDAALLAQPLFNQRVWDARPDRALESALKAIEVGGFSDDCMGRRVGNYEGQIMAIRRGWAERDGHYTWKVTQAGLDALRENGRPVPAFLPAFDNWHGKAYEICAYEKTLHSTGEPILQL